jgi:hypothetical protein
MRHKQSPAMQSRACPTKLLSFSLIAEKTIEFNGDDYNA